jgi:hypothetical protein
MQSNGKSVPVIYKHDMHNILIFMLCIFIVSIFIAFFGSNNRGRTCIIDICAFLPVLFIFVVPRKVKRLYIFKDRIIFKHIQFTREILFSDIRGFTLYGGIGGYILIRQKSQAKPELSIPLDMYTDEQIPVMRKTKPRPFPLLDWFDSKWPRINEPVDLTNQ